MVRAVRVDRWFCAALAIVEVEVLIPDVCQSNINTGDRKESGIICFNSFAATEAQVVALQYPDRALGVGRVCAIFWQLGVCDGRLHKSKKLLRQFRFILLLL